MQYSNLWQKEKAYPFKSRLPSDLRSTDTKIIPRKNHQQWWLYSTHTIKRSFLIPFGAIYIHRGMYAIGLTQSSPTLLTNKLYHKKKRCIKHLYFNLFLFIAITIKTKYPKNMMYSSISTYPKSLTISLF